MTLSRELAAAARRFADANSERIADVQGSSRIVLDIVTVTPGAGLGGNALLTVSWRGSTQAAAGYNPAYTPAPGDRVMCDYVNNQIFVDYRIVN